MASGDDDDDDNDDDEEEETKRHEKDLVVDLASKRRSGSKLWVTHGCGRLCNVLLFFCLKPSTNPNGGGDCGDILLIRVG